MKGPLAMRPETIRQNVPAGPGAYVLGAVGNRALYVSRAEDLRARLLMHFASPGPNTVHVDQFWFEVAAGAWEA